MNKTSLSFSDLTTAIIDGDLFTLRNYLESGIVSPNECDENGQTLLMTASQYGQTVIVSELIAQGADVNAEDSDNWSALMNAAKAGHKDVVIKLLDNGALIEQRDMGGWSPLMWACYKNRMDVAYILLEHGASVNVHDKNHCTCLTWAAGRGYVEIVDLLLDHGAKVHSGDKYGTSPLVWACRKGFTEIVQALLNAGANVDTAGMFSWTPLIVATKGNYVNIVDMLLEHKPNVNAIDMDGCTALTLACKEGFTEIAVAFMNAGAYISLQDRNGDTNLIHASKAGHFSIVDALLKKYADVDLQGSDGKTALYWAVEKGYADIVRLILSANPNLELATKDGDTPLLKATRIRSAEIVQMLVDKKCKVSAMDKKGDSALHIAMRAQSKAIVEILLRNPKNSQLLYRPNRAGETPYNIDASHQRSILAQIFGARRLNTNEDSENRLGYDLYSSALADILSEPSLSMPISVGLYAKWGSGKSFLLDKLENEMRNFAIQWMEPVFEISWLVFLLVLLVSAICGLISSLATQMWTIGVFFGTSIFIVTFIFLGAIIYGNKKYDWNILYKISVTLASQLSALRTLLFVTFCNPPAKRRDVLTNPVRFLFTEQTKVTSSGGDNSVVQILISLYLVIEKEYGYLTSRMFRVFRPKPVSARRWQWRKLCCIPSFIVALFVLICILGGLTLLLLTETAENRTEEQTTVVHSILIALACVICLILASNFYTWVKMVAVLVISHQRRIMHQISTLESSQSINYVTSLKSEVDTIVQMVQCLDAFVGQQTRLVVIVDGLDSCEQEKVLHILDAVHLLFSDASAPFVTVLAIDPHIVIKAIEANIHRVFHNSSINGHEYLRNVVHLPFYLQNSGLRRVKAAQQAAVLWTKKSTSYWNEDKECDRAAPVLSGRKASNTSMNVGDNFRKRAKSCQKLKASESMASSISNLHRVVTGAQDLTKVLLTDDYFSDVNPRSMRRLMNIVYITGRLLKAFNIDFNWYHLASWVNITEQWPYRTSWIIMFYEMHENDLDEMMSLKSVYERIKRYMPTTKDEDPTLDLDHDERKFEVFLSFHSVNLLINDLKVFLPFTINLDPYIRKTIQEDHQQASEILKADLKTFYQPFTKPDPVKWTNISQNISHQPLISGNKMADFQNWNSGTPVSSVFTKKPSIYPHPVTPISPYHNSGFSSWWNFTPESMVPYTAMQNSPRLAFVQSLSGDQKLSSLSVDGVISILTSQEQVDKQKLSMYTTALKENNINGQVLLTCDLRELKDVLNMSFGDWELFRTLILNLRDQELELLASSNMVDDMQNRVPASQIGGKPAAVVNRRSSPCGSESPDLKKKETSNNHVKVNSDSTDSRLYSRNRSASSVLEKQVTMEESMIVGALETLNEEAQEDAMEEQLALNRDSNAATASSEAASNSLSPIMSDPEEHINVDQGSGPIHVESSTVQNISNSGEIDVLYLQNLRKSPSLHISAISLTDSIPDIETSSLGKPQLFQPLFGKSSPVLHTNSIAGTSFEYPSASSSPAGKRSAEKSSVEKIKNQTPRPSSLIYCSKQADANFKSLINIEGSAKKNKVVNITENIHGMLQEKVHSLSSISGKRSKKKTQTETNVSSDSSTETEDNVCSNKKKVLDSNKLVTPQSEGDVYFSDDEHTPLVSPFHVNRSSHYNLQAAQKHDKEGTPEKQIPKKSYSESVFNQKNRKPLERQFSVDNYLCEQTKLPVTSASMVEIQDQPPSPSYTSHSSSSPQSFAVYSQLVSDSTSPEQLAIYAEADTHNETVL